MGEDILPVYWTLRDTKDFDVRLSNKEWTGVLSVSTFVLRGWVANIALAQRYSSGNSGFPSSGRRAPGWLVLRMRRSRGVAGSFTYYMYFVCDQPALLFFPPCFPLLPAHPRRYSCRIDRRRFGCLGVFVLATQQSFGDNEAADTAQTHVCTF